MLGRVGEKRNVYKTIRNRRNRMTVHLLRHEGDILEMKVETGEGRSRYRIDY